MKKRWPRTVDRPLPGVREVCVGGGGSLQKGAGLGGVTARIHKGSVKSSGSARTGVSVRNDVGPGICWLMWCGLLGSNLRVEWHTRVYAAIQGVGPSERGTGPQAEAHHKPKMPKGWNQG